MIGPVGIPDAESTITDGGKSQGSSLPGLYFNNEEGARIVGEFDEEDDEE